MEESESKDNIKNSDPNNHDTMSEQGKEYIWEQLWLSVINEIAYNEGIINKIDYQRMRLRIRCRKYPKQKHPYSVSPESGV